MYTQGTNKIIGKNISRKVCLKLSVRDQRNLFVVSISCFKTKIVTSLVNWTEPIHNIIIYYNSEYCLIFEILWIYLAWIPFLFFYFSFTKYLNVCKEFEQMLLSMSE
jgi:hypothetical protein